MVNDGLILRVERLAVSLQQFRRSLRDRYNQDSQVNSSLLRQEARRLAEEWMVQVAPFPGVSQALGEVAGDISIQFTRLLRYSERRSPRRLYDTATAAIVRDFNERVLFPLKRARDAPLIVAMLPERSLASIQSAFVGHSFAPADETVVSAVIRVLTAFNIRVETGERPSADSVSRKVKRRIDRCEAFVAIFTRRERIAGQQAYTTSTWVIDEKAYAIAGNKKLVILKDALLNDIGGLQGDYEYVSFEPDAVVDLIVRLVELLTER